VIAWITLIRTAKAETCYRKIDNSIERLAGFRWSWRTVDGKQCWYYARNILPREDLVWSFTEEEFNADIDRVLERKLYKPILDENRLLLEAD
jgi:hypothetical protein